MMHATGKHLTELEKRVNPTTERMEVWWGNYGPDGESDRFTLDRDAPAPVWLSRAEIAALPETPGETVTRIFVVYSDAAAKA